MNKRSEQPVLQRDYTCGQINTWKDAQKSLVIRDVNRNHGILLNIWDGSNKNIKMLTNMWRNWNLVHGWWECKMVLPQWQFGGGWMVVQHCECNWCYRIDATEYGKMVKIENFMFIYFNTVQKYLKSFPFQFKKLHRNNSHYLWILYFRIHYSLKFISNPKWIIVPLSH